MAVAKLMVHIEKYLRTTVHFGMCRFPGIHIFIIIHIITLGHI